MQPESKISGVFAEDTHIADVDAVLDELEAVELEEMERREDESFHYSND